MSRRVRIYDTLSGQKIELINKEVKAYFCGPTVYDVPHLGHARAYVVFDVLIRLLRYLGYDVKYVRNITDVDDKIIRRAQEEGVSPFEIAERYFYEFYDAMKALDVIPPNVEPRASAHIPEIIKFVDGLIEKGYAYETPDGVYFRVRKFKGYGKLSKRSIEQMRAGARIEPSPYKEDPLDFALWKKSKPNEPAWDSPWGPGRPGWHIECSAMALKHLGETIDIHGGGEDLIFPHHENEIAQSEAFTGKQFARIWFHVGLLVIGREKMAKSLGNIVSIREAIKKYDRETVRLYLLSVHYRKQLEFTWSRLDEAERILDEIYRGVFLAEYYSQRNVKGGVRDETFTYVAQVKDEFLKLLANNLKTGEAIKLLHSVSKKILSEYSRLSGEELRVVAKTIRELGNILGILQQSIEERIEEKRKRNKDLSRILPPGYMPEKSGLDRDLIELIVDVREELRRRKMYELADKIRARLREMGIILEDTSQGTKYIISK